ncbi:hypothetical protein ACFL1R_05595 [Candidatus Latescibacterota bacterium]
MEKENRVPAHKGFLRRSGLYISLIFLTSLCELGLNSVAARLPAGSYITFWQLMKIFFIVTAPLMAVQLVVSKEVASYSVLGEYGKRRNFVERTYYYTMIPVMVIIVIGLLLSPVISSFLNLDSMFPVVLLFTTILFYFLLPALYGTIQGLKKFISLGLVQFSWSFFRLLFGAIIIIGLSGNLTHFLMGIVAATFITVLLSIYPARTIFKYHPERITKEEILHAYGLILPMIGTLVCITVMKNADVVFAGRFFDPVSGDAYACAAFVGSGFYVLSGIFMVMVPMVSEENTRGRNPIIFLVKSCLFVLTFSIIGIIVAWCYPELVMNLSTLGEPKFGAEVLIKWIGVAVTPVSLILIMGNYMLAKHQSRFILILFLGMVLQLAFICFIHDTPLKMLAVIIIANWVTFVLMLGYIIVEHRQYMKTLSVQ